MNKMAGLSRELAKMLILQHRADLGEPGGKPLSEVLKILDSVRVS